MMGRARYSEEGTGCCAVGCGVGRILRCEMVSVPGGELNDRDCTVDAGNAGCV